MSGTRVDVEFLSDGTTCRAWLYLPATAAPAPILVMAHGLGGVREMRLDAFAERFRAAGYACLVFDYRHFGASDGEPRQLLRIESQLEDWRSAIAAARADPRVDGHRVVLWGTSFGGGHVLIAAARDPGVASVIAQCPFTDAAASIRRSNPLSFARASVRALADVVGARLGQRPVTVPIAGRPGQAALMTARDAVSGYAALQPAATTFRNWLTARSLFEFPGHAPGRSAARLAMPVLFCLCDEDSVTPAATSLRYARQAPRGVVRCYPVGHFAIYVGDAFERAVADQIAFLREHVAV